MAGSARYSAGGNASNPAPPVVIDGTGLTTTVPLTVKNGKSGSGIELQVTGTVATGYLLRDSGGTQKGVFGYAVAGNDWFTGSGAGDTVLRAEGRLFLDSGSAGTGVRIRGSANASIVLNDSVGTVITYGSSVLTLSSIATFTGAMAIDSSASLTSVALQIAGDSNSGIAQLNGADTLSVVLGGTERIALSSLAAIFGTPVRISNSASLTDVSLQISGDGNTGISQQGGADKLSVIAGGAEMMRFESAGLTCFVGLFMASGQIISVDSSTSLTNVPLRRAGDVNTGISFPSGNDTIAIVAGGTKWIETVAATGTTTFACHAQWGDGLNLQFGSTTGSKIGVNTANKIGFWNATPVVQPSSTGETVGFTAGAGTGVKDDSTFTGNVGSTAYRISDVVKHLKTIGILAA